MYSTARQGVDSSELDGPGPWLKASPTAGTLYLAAPSPQAGSQLREYFLRLAVPVSEPHAGVFAVPLAPGRLQQLCHDVGRLLTHMDLRDARTLVVAPGVVPTICELPNTESLSTLIGRVQGEWLVDLLREDRLVTHYQPIIPCRDPEKVFAYESLLRGIDHDGTLIPPNVIFSVAKSAELTSYLDRAARFAAIRGALRHKLESKLFINFIPTAIYDPAFSLSKTVLEVEQGDIDPARVVFEVVESEQVPDVDRMLDILESYRHAGFLIALDDLGAGYSSLTLLTRLKPDFVKLDVELVRAVDNDRYKANIACKLLELARSLGIQTIAEGVETQGEWLWLREHQCDFVQGFFFGRPASPPLQMTAMPTPRSLARTPAAPPSRQRAPRPGEPRAGEIRRLYEKIGELVMELDSEKKRRDDGQGGDR